MRRFLIALAAVFALGPAAAAQTQPDLAAHRAEIARLSFLEGNWTGAGWMIGPDRVRREFTQTERVETRLGGQLVVIEGTGADPAGGEIVFRALAVVAWDPAANHFAMRNWLDGRSHEVSGELMEENLFRWGFDAGAARIRYTIDGRTAGQWREIGDVSMDGGATWFQFFEMNLTRE